MTLTPTPRTAATIAEIALPFVKQTYGVDLDYSPHSLKQVDGILDDLRKDQKFEDVQPILFSLGCYLGEVFVRHARGAWRNASEIGMVGVASSPIVVQLPDGRGCNPVGKVYKRFQSASEDGIAWFYHSNTQIPMDKVTGKQAKYRL